MLHLGQLLIQISVLLTSTKQLHKFIDKNVIDTKIQCTPLYRHTQKLFFMSHASSIYALSATMHISGQYTTLCHTVNEFNYCHMQQLCLMLQQLDGKPNVVFQHDSAPLHFYSDVTTFLVACGMVWSRGGPLPGLWNLQIGTPWLFSRGFMKRDIYIPPAPITPNNLQQWIWTVITKTDQSLLKKNYILSQILFWCMQGNKWGTH